MIRTLKGLIVFCCLLLISMPAFAAWTVIPGQESGCTTCGKIEAGKSTVAFRIKVTGDGTTCTAAENLLVPVGNYQGKFLYDVTIENPASGGPSGTWDLVLQDSETGKTITNESALDNTASATVVVPVSDVTGKFEKILGYIRIVSGDTDLGSAEYVYMVFTFIE